MNISFDIKGFKKANHVRRSLISEVETLAINKVYVYENTTNLANDFICHRLAFCPVNSDILYRECSNGNMKTDNKDIDYNLVTFSLNVSCDQDEMYVTSGMIVSNHPDVFMADPDIILIKLYKNQTLRFKSTIKKGTAKDHAKWASVIMCDYNVSSQTINVTFEPIGNLSLDILHRIGMELINN